jgi:hypothetical protein
MFSMLNKLYTFVTTAYWWTCTVVGDQICNDPQSLKKPYQ